MPIRLLSSNRTQKPRQRFGSVPANHSSAGISNRRTTPRNEVRLPSTKQFCFRPQKSVGPEFTIGNVNLQKNLSLPPDTFLTFPHWRRSIMAHDTSPFWRSRHPSHLAVSPLRI